MSAVNLCRDFATGEAVEKVPEGKIAKIRHAVQDKWNKWTRRSPRGKKVVQPRRP
jgi:hypothetical protein